MQPFITQAMPLTDALLNVIAHLPTKSLSATERDQPYRYPSG
jgi:hypothetical protein